MPMIRLRPFNTTLTAAGTVGGLLTMASTSGITRNSIIGVTHATGGWEIQVVRIVDATHLLGRVLDGMVRNRMDLSAIPNGAAVILPEQWVQDLYQDDVPQDLAIPVK